MSVSNSKSPKSIFDSQDSNDLKERQRLEELKRQAKVQQVKLDKRLNKQKILMGAFLGQVLASDGRDEKIIQKYFATNFPSYLTRESDKFLFKSMIESLGSDMGLGKEVDPSMARENQLGNQDTNVNSSNNEQVNHESNMTNIDQSDLTLSNQDCSEQQKNRY